MAPRLSVRVPPDPDVVVILLLPVVTFRPSTVWLLAALSMPITLNVPPARFSVELVDRILSVNAVAFLKLSEIAPPLMVVSPVKLLAPVRVSVLVPCFSRLPLPVILPAKSVLVEPFTVSVAPPKLTLPPVPLSELSVVSKAPRSSVPPLTVAAFGVVPSACILPTTSVPLFTPTSPVNVLALDNIQLPAPSTRKLPVPETVPASVLVPAKLPPSVSVPVSATSPLSVSAPVPSFARMALFCAVKLRSLLSPAPK
ncbi:Uncharacterised protein [Brucella suis]|nr:Uncharacterised protein [Brucella suis]